MKQLKYLYTDLFKLKFSTENCSQFCGEMKDYYKGLDENLKKKLELRSS